eukprot:scaffold107829_cov29-Prasinocladus_malaysianus.AAC.1
MSDTEPIGDQSLEALVVRVAEAAGRHPAGVHGDYNARASHIPPVPLCTCRLLHSYACLMCSVSELGRFDASLGNNANHFCVRNEILGVQCHWREFMGNVLFANAKDCKN